MFNHDSSSNKQLADESLWTLPIAPNLSEDFAKSPEESQSIALGDQEGVIFAAMHVNDNLVPTWHARPRWCSEPTA